MTEALWTHVNSSNFCQTFAEDGPALGTGCNELAGDHALPSQEARAQIPTLPPTHCLILANELLQALAPS